METYDGTFVGDCGLTVQDVEGTPHVEGVEHLVALIRPDNVPSQGVARNLGMELERTAFVHGADALVLGMRLDAAG